jgi:hypothetical protein
MKKSTKNGSGRERPPSAPLVDFDAYFSREAVTAADKWEPFNGLQSPLRFKPRN